MYKLVPVTQIPKGRPVDINDTSKWKEVAFFLHQYARTNPCLGVHAVQFGIPMQIFVCNDTIYLNCVYLSTSSDTIKSVEGCLSIPDKTYTVYRFKDIRVKGYTFKNNRIDFFDQIFNVSSNKKSTIVFQHEIDHQDGILISDIGQDITPVPC